MSIIADRLQEILGLDIEHGSHTIFDAEDTDKKLCIMEAMSYVAGEPHSDAPVCASAVISDFLIDVNDSRDGEERNKLKAVMEDVIGTCPTKMGIRTIRVKGRSVEIEATVRDETPGYDAAENRRRRRLYDECFALGAVRMGEGKNPKDYPGDGRWWFDPLDIDTDDALRITRLLAAIKA